MVTILPARAFDDGRDQLHRPALDEPPENVALSVDSNP
jgi:hypothetical protein